MPIPLLPDIYESNWTMSKKYADLSDAEIRKKLSELHEPNLWHFLADVLFDWSGIFAAYYFILYFNTAWSYLIGFIIIGWKMHCLFVLEHECQHFSSGLGGFKKVWLEDFASNLMIGYWTFTTAHLHRKMHITHHKYIMTDRDPEFVMWRYAQPRSWFDLPISYSTLALRLFKQSLGVGPFYLNAFGDVFGVQASSVWDNVQIALANIIAFSTLSYFGGWQFALKIYTIWIVSGRTFFAAMFEWRSWCEHFGLPPNGEFMYGNEIDTHRIYIPLWMRWACPHNIWVHYEHHFDAAIPYYNLKKAREILHPHVPVLHVSEFLYKYSKCAPAPTGVPLKVKNTPTN